MESESRITRRIEGSAMGAGSKSGRIQCRYYRWCKSDGGNVSLEIAFVLTFLLVLAIGAVDFGRYAMANLSLESATRAGLQYGMQDQAAATEISQIVQAVRDDAGDTDGSIGVTARQYCSCPGETELACSASCTDGSYPEMYVEVTATDQLVLLFDYPGVAQPLPISRTSEIRVR